MSKASSSKRPPAKRPPRPKLRTVDEYIAALQEPARGTLNKIRAAARSAAPPDATEVISYGIPALKHRGVIIWFAAFDRHCSLFPTASVIDTFKKELQGYTTSKGTIQFPIDKPLPNALVRKLVQARVRQIQSKELRSTRRDS